MDGKHLKANRYRPTIVKGDNEVCDFSILLFLSISLQLHVTSYLSPLPSSHFIYLLPSFSITFSSPSSHFNSPPPCFFLFTSLHSLISSSSFFFSHTQIDEEGEDEAFDQYGLTLIMKDYMYADQATRYQVVKNHFQRAVNDAKVCLASSSLVVF